jgi:hypothetical protein
MLHKVTSKVNRGHAGKRPAATECAKCFLCLEKPSDYRTVFAYRLGAFPTLVRKLPTSAERTPSGIFYSWRRELMVRAASRTRACEHAPYDSARAFGRHLLGGRQPKIPGFQRENGVSCDLRRIFPKDTIRVSRVFLGPRKIALPSSSKSAVFSRSKSRRSFFRGVGQSRGKRPETFRRWVGASLDPPYDYIQVSDFKVAEEVA